MSDLDFRLPPIPYGTLIHQSLQSFFLDFPVLEPLLRLYTAELCPLFCLSHFPALVHPVSPETTARYLEVFCQLWLGKGLEIQIIHQ